MDFFEGVCKCGKEFSLKSSVDPSIKFVRNLNFSFCETHPDYQAVYLCQGEREEKCNQIICVACREQNAHKNHKLTLIRDFIEANTKKISKTKENVNNLIWEIDQKNELFTQEKKKSRENLVSETKKIQQNAEKVKAISAQIKEEKKKELQSKTLGDLPSIYKTMQRRLEEFEKRFQ